MNYRAWCALGAGRPPTIIDQSSQEMTYKVSEKVELVCVASGDPLPSYAANVVSFHLIYNISANFVY